MNKKSNNSWEKKIDQVQKSFKRATQLGVLENNFRQLD